MDLIKFNSMGLLKSFCGAAAFVFLCFVVLIGEFNFRRSGEQGLGCVFDLFFGVRQTKGCYCIRPSIEHRSRCKLNSADA